MEVTRQGLAEIVGHEGIVQMPYRDSVGVWTWGVGHTAGAGAPDPAKMPKGVARPISEVMQQFAVDIKKYEARVDKAISRPMLPHQNDALVSFDYNTGGIFRANLTKLFNAGNVTAAANAFMGWVRPPEIIGRRRAEQALFRTGKYGDGYATVYPASASGRVQWSKGVRVRVIDYLEDEALATEKPTESFATLRDFQLALMTLGYDLPRWGADGSWGDETKAAVKAFQADSDGRLVVDGILGPLTKAAIREAMSNRPAAVAGKSVGAMSLVSAGVAVAGFTPMQIGAFAVMALAVYLTWHFMDDIEEVFYRWTH